MNVLTQQSRQLQQQLLNVLVAAVRLTGKVITGVMMRTTIVDVNGMVEIVVGAM